MKLKQIAAIAAAALMLMQSTVAFAEEAVTAGSESTPPVEISSSIADSVVISGSVISEESSSSSSLTEEQPSSVASSSSETSSSSQVISSSSSSSSSSSEASSSEDTAESAEMPAQADPVTEFVTRMYKIALNRVPDNAGVADWTNRLRSGTAKGVDIMSGFFNSPEYTSLNKSDADFVKDLYLAAFGRTADEGGLQDWLTRLGFNISRSYVIEGFAGSAEFINMCASYGITSGHLTLTENRDKNINITAFVSRLYKVALGHAPEIAGLNDWTGKIISGEVNGAQAVHGFFLSDEYKKQNKSDTAFVSDLYNVMLNRTADSASSTWTSALDSGVSRDYAINGISGSAEFQNLCRQYGINGGSLALTQPRDKNIKVTSFVQSFYKGLLKRNGDETGLNDWTNRLLTGSSSGTNVAMGFIGSSEMTGKKLTNAEYVALMYNVALGRTASAAEVDGWVKHLDNGCTRDYIIFGFINSQEFQKKCAAAGVSFTAYAVTNNCDKNPAVTAIVHRLFIHALGRASVSTSDLNARTGTLLENKTTAASMINEFFSSAEYTARNLNSTDFIRAAYKAILGRDANDVEVATQLSYLSTHAAKDFLAVLVDSAEFRKICSDAGIVSGSLTPSKAVYNMLDVSKFQADIDWSAVAASGQADWVIVRAVSTDNNGVYVDPYFAANVIGAKRAGFKVGVYYFMSGTTVAECATEVNLMLNEIAKLEAQGYYLDLPVACDIESNLDGLNKNDLTMLGRYSMNLIENAGYYPILYTGVNFSQNSLDLSQIGSRDLWIAWYPYLLYNGEVYGVKGTANANVSPPIGATPCTKSGNPTNPSSAGINSYSIWQYRSDARISGINAAVDVNYAYKDYATILATTVRSDGTKWNHLK